jgi:hypothetical protein
VIRKKIRKASLRVLKEGCSGHASSSLPAPLRKVAYNLCTQGQSPIHSIPPLLSRPPRLRPVMTFLRHLLRDSATPQAPRMRRIPLPDVDDFIMIEKQQPKPLKSALKKPKPTPAPTAPTSTAHRIARQFSLLNRDDGYSTTPESSVAPSAHPTSRHRRGSLTAAMATNTSAPAPTPAIATAQTRQAPQPTKGILKHPSAYLRFI